jgi:hypothetical protein
MTLLALHAAQILVAVWVVVTLLAAIFVGREAVRTDVPGDGR